MMMPNRVLHESFETRDRSNELRTSDGVRLEELLLLGRELAFFTQQRPVLLMILTNVVQKSRGGDLIDVSSVQSRLTSNDSRILLHPPRMTRRIRLHGFKIGRASCRESAEITE